MKVPVCELPVMKAMCKTCPFLPDENGRMRDPQMAGQVQARTLFQGQQICHGTEGKNRKPNNRCKGAFDANMQIYDRLGVSHLIIK